MKLKNTTQFRLFIRDMLRKSISDDYVDNILDEIIDDVVEDVECCADENWNEDDVRLAIGRVLCNRLGC